MSSPFASSFNKNLWLFGLITFFYSCIKKSFILLKRKVTDTTRRLLVWIQCALDWVLSLELFSRRRRWRLVSALLFIKLQNINFGLNLKDRNQICLSQYGAPWLRIVLLSFYEWANPQPLLLFIFGLFKQTSLQFLHLIYVKKCPSSIQYQDSNPQPLEHESPPVTTRPGLPPKPLVGPEFRKPV